MADPAPVFLFDSDFKKFGAEAVGEEVVQRKGAFLARCVQTDDLQIRGKFPHHLPADAAGNAEIIASAGDHDPLECGVALSNGMEDSVALGTDAGGLGGVFHIAAGVHGAVLAFQSGAHGKVGIGDIGTVQHGNRCSLQFVSGHEITPLYIKFTEAMHQPERFRPFWASTALPAPDGHPDQ